MLLSCFVTHHLLYMFCSYILVSCIINSQDSLQLKRGPNKNIFKLSSGMAFPPQQSIRRLPNHIERSIVLFHVFRRTNRMYEKDCGKCENCQLATFAKCPVKRQQFDTISCATFLSVTQTCYRHVTVRTFKTCALRQTLNSRVGRLLNNYATHW